MEARKSVYYQKMSQDMQIRYDEKISSCHDIDPYLLDDKDLSYSKEDFPEISLLDIANHMVHSVSPFTKKQFNNYKGMEAYSFFESGFVLNVGSRKLNDSAILTGKVKHSQRMNEPPCKVWIVAKMNGEIMCAHCTCLAGLSETCSHVGAIAYAVMNVTESTENTSVTDILCKWNVPKLKSASMSRVKEINWRDTSYDQNIVPSRNANESFVSHVDSIEKFEDDVIISFINDVCSDGPEPALRTLLYPEEKRRASSIKDEVFLSNLYNKDYFNRSLNDLVKIAKSVKLEISEEDIAEITRVTLVQRQSKFWISLKRGRITGSNIKDCCIASINSPPITTISRVINPIDFNHTPSGKYAKKHRKRAIKDYNREALLNHQNFEYEARGLIFNPEMPFFTDWSDGILSCNCHGKGCLIIKCLSVLETQSFDILTRKPNNILSQIGELYYLESTHEFYYKAQLNICLSETNYCDFVLWSSTKTLNLRVNHDVEFWKMVSLKASTFHEHVIMPEVLGKFFTKRTDGKSSHVLRDQDLDEEYLELVDLEIELLDENDHNV